MNSTINPSDEKEATSKLLDKNTSIHGHASDQDGGVVRVIPPLAPQEGKTAAQPETKRPSGRGLGFALFVFIIAAAVVVGYLLWQRSRTHDQLVTATNDLSVPTVSTMTPKPGPTETEVVLPGSLTAYSETPIYARTNGYVKAWYTDIGAKVTAGQLMAELEAPDVDAQLRQATANLAQTRANLDFAKLNFDRSKNLLATKVVSQQEFDQNRTALDAQQAAVLAGDASVQNLKVMQDFQKITAPFPGVVTRRNTDVGALINAGTGSASNNAQELFHIARTDILRVFINVPQVYSSLVQIDTPAYLSVAEQPGKKIAGKVAHIAGGIDAASRTLLVEVQVPNPDGQLFPGAYADVHLVLQIKSAPVVIPVNTVIFRTQGVQVGVVDDSNIVHLKNITLGSDFGSTLEVTSGIDSHDRIILNPSDSLSDGTKVNVENPAEKTAAK